MIHKIIFRNRPMFREQVEYWFSPYQPTSDIAYLNQGNLFLRSESSAQIAIL